MELGLAGAKKHKSAYMKKWNMRRKNNMEMNYRGKRYALMECVEPGGLATYGIISIFKIVKKKGFETYEFVDYFYYANEEDIIEFAKNTIKMRGK